MKLTGIYIQISMAAAQLTFEKWPEMIESWPEIGHFTYPYLFAYFNLIQYNLDRSDNMRLLNLDIKKFTYKRAVRQCCVIKYICICNSNTA